MAAYAGRAETLCGRLAVPHPDGPGVPYFNFLAAFHAIGFHWLFSF